MNKNPLGSPLRPLGAVIGIAASLAGLPAQAHDTWFEPRPATLPGALSMVLGTGAAFPIFDSGIDSRYLVKHACRGDLASAPSLPLTPQGNEPGHQALQLNTAPEARTCWAQLAPFEIDLEADKIPEYLKEIGASAQQRAVWAGIARRGLPWRESYTKYARVEFGAPSDQPVPLDLDLLLEGVKAPLKAGETLHFRVLRDGRPLPQQAIELRGDRLPFGIWRTTDREGRAQVTVPTAGRWVLRGVDLRLSAERPDSWVSRFITLTFDVGAAAR